MKNNIGFISISQTSGHTVRGIGFYALNLLEQLKVQQSKYDVQIIETSQPSSKYSIVHYPYLDLFLNTLPIKKITKTIVTIHDVIPLEYPNIYKLGLKAKLNLQLQKIALQNVDQILTDSLASAKSIHKHLGIPHEKIKVIYLAAHSRFKPLTNKKALADVQKRYALPEKFVLYIGDINYPKNINTLIETCIALQIPLCLGGKNITEMDMLDVNHPELQHVQKTKTLIQNPLIKLLGFIPDNDLIAIYNLATLYCQPSLSEGFGIPVLEAMSCATPILVSKADALTEIVGPYLSSFQFDANNPLNLREHLEKLWNSPSLRKENSTLALKRSRDFSWSKTAQQTLLVYKQVL